MSAPSAASPSEMARPMPRPPPVTSATRPASPDPSATETPLLVGEARGPLLHERLHRFHQITGEARKHLRAILEIDARLQAPDLELTPHDFLGHANTERAVADDQ